MDDMINRHDSIAEENMVVRPRMILKNGAVKFLTVQTMFSRMIRKTVPTKAVRNV